MERDATIVIADDFTIGDNGLLYENSADVHIGATRTTPFLYAGGVPPEFSYLNRILGPINFHVM